jgi:site-specific recombinase XerD
MTGRNCAPGDFDLSEWVSAVQEKYSPISFLLDTQTKTEFPRHPLPSLPQTDWSAPDWLCASKKRQDLEHYSGRLTSSGIIGADLAVEYLRDKYRNNRAIATIKQASGVILSFLHFLNEAGTNILKITRQDICAFVEHEQDRGLKINSVISNLRDVYTFINFLVEQEVLPQTINSKKIRLKMPEVLPRAIPEEHTTALLSEISNIRNRALILLLLRTGLRIGELLNVKVSDIVMPERKILIYLAEKNDQGRVVYFGSDADIALQEWLVIRNKQKEYLFYSPSREKITYAAARKIMVKALEKAGLSHYGYSLHSLRHTFATDMLNAGLRLEVLQQILGHQSIEITLRYARLSDTTRENEYFRAMTVIEKGGHHESHRINSQLQAVFEEKKLLTSHHKKLSA